MSTTGSTKTGHTITVDVDMAAVSSRDLEQIDQAMALLREIPAVTRIDGWDA